MLPGGHGPSGNVVGVIQAVLIVLGVALRIKPGGRIGRIGIGIAALGFAWMALSVFYR